MGTSLFSSTGSVIENPLMHLQDANVLPTLRPLHGLTHLHLVFHGKVSSEENAPDTFLYHLQSPHFDYAGLTSAIVFALPSLKYCFIATSTADRGV